MMLSSPKTTSARPFSPKASIARSNGKKDQPKTASPKKWFSGNFFNKVVLIAAIGVLANLGLIWYAAESSVFNSLSLIHPLWFIGLLVTSFIHWFIHALRLKVWVSFIGYNISYNKLFQVAMGTQLGAAISPSAVGGEPLKAGMLIHHGLKSEEAVSITLLNILEDLIFFMIALPLLLWQVDLGDYPFFQELNFDVARFLPWIFAFAGLFALLYWGARKIRHSKTPSWLKRMLIWLRGKWESALALWQLVGKRGKKRLAFNLTTVSIQWVIRYNVATLLIWGLGLDITFSEAFLLQCFVYMLMMFIPTPGATVGAEATFYAVFALVLATDYLSVITAGWRFFPIISPWQPAQFFSFFANPSTAFPQQNPSPKRKLPEPPILAQTPILHYVVPVKSVVDFT